jgi:SPP1 family phage portal protein
MESETRQLFGRRQIYTDVEEITAANVVDVLNKALYVHALNQAEIDYLWRYYKGETPILQKQKEIRETINHKIWVNRANEIVTFKKGYGFGEPIQYIRRGQDETLSDDINRLNEYMALAGKQLSDSRIAEWLYVCGLGMRMALPGEDAEEPFVIYTLDPRYSFIIRHNGLGEKPVMGVKIIEKETGAKVYSVYTRDRYFEIEGTEIVKEEAHILGDVPIFEFPAPARLGAFEVVLPILDAINEIESNRLDDLVQSVNSFLAILGATIDEETSKKLDELKMLCLPDGVDAKYLSTALHQADIQVLVDNLYDAVITITGMPNRNISSSGGDNGVAVELRNGWQNAESHMKSVEQEFKEAEKPMLKMILRILKDTPGVEMDLKLANVETKFTRRNYDNIQTKSQVLTTMLANPRIHPELAFTHSGLFLDPESAYLQSKEWWEAQEQKEAEETEKYVQSLRDGNGGDTDTVQQDGQDDQVA